jgi:hypothetical protein
VTPEGRVKARITALLKTYEPDIYWNMPVPGGYGKSRLDYDGAIRGRAFAIEAKRPGKDMTTRQEGTVEDMQRGGVMCFMVATDDDLAILKGWLDAIVRKSGR